MTVALMNTHLVLMTGPLAVLMNTHLVLMTGPLAVLSEALQGLVDERHIVFIDVESKEAKSTRSAPTDTVQELECLTHQIVVGLVRLVSQVVLKAHSQN